MATYRHWSVFLWRDPDDLSHCWILSPDKTEWRFISATLCGWRCCFVADQLWLMTRIREEEEYWNAARWRRTEQSVIPVRWRLDDRLRSSSHCFNVMLHSSIWMYSMNCSRRTCKHHNCSSLLTAFRLNLYLCHWSHVYNDVCHIAILQENSATYCYRHATSETAEQWTSECC